MFFWRRKKKEQEEAANEAEKEALGLLDEAEGVVSDGADAGMPDAGMPDTAGSTEGDSAAEDSVAEGNADEDSTADNCVAADNVVEDNAAEDVAAEKSAAEDSVLEDDIENAISEGISDNVISDAAIADEDASRDAFSTDDEGHDAFDDNDGSDSEDTSDSGEMDVVQYQEEPKKKGFFARLREGLAKTRKSIANGFDSIFSGFSSIDDDFYDELEELMITGDMGVRTTDAILEKLRERVKEEHIREPAACRQVLIDSIREQMDVGENAYEFENRTSVLLVVGVNGVGKTTSIGKLASQMKNKGKKVLLAAADTFRAGAVEQLAEWSRRAQVDLISSGEGADPAAVVFDAVSAAKARKTDILIVDTAGRLHNKKNLMEELRKISRVIDREFPEAYRETLAVVDATTGQNALSQAREFMEVSDVSGIILTKMDGTAKGGIAVAIQSELHLPVKYIGVGEQIDDLQKFNAEQYVHAIFDEDEGEKHA